MQQHGHGHVVRQVRHERIGLVLTAVGRIGRGFGGVLRFWQRRDAEGIGVDQLERRVTAGEPVDRARQLLRKQFVDLDRGDGVTGFEQAEGERTESRTDFDDARVLFETGGGDDRAHGIGVDDEVLALLLRRAQTDVSG